MRVQVLITVFVATFMLTESAVVKQFRRRATREEKRSGGVTLSKLAHDVLKGREEGFKEVNHMKVPGAKGEDSVRVIQTYGGMEVEGTAAEVEETHEGALTGEIHGLVAIGLEKDIPDKEVCPQLVEDMIAIAVKAEGLDPADEKIINAFGKRVVRIDQETGVGVLAYYVEFVYRGKPVSRPTYYINACNKSVITSFNQIQNATLSILRRGDDECEGTPEPTPPPDGQCTDKGGDGNGGGNGGGNEGGCDPSVTGEGGNQKFGKITYNARPYCLPVQRSGSRCVMSNEYAKVVDNGNTEDCCRQTIVSFNCDQGHRDYKNGAYGVANDALFFGTITGRLYVEKYGVRALPHIPRMVVHHAQNLDNAFWDGTDMWFGDGGYTFYPLVCQDVVTHELGHGITSKNSNLEYRGQSGGINEAFSDISGEVAEFWSTGSNDWKIGAALMKNEAALRFMDNPPADRRSIKHVRDYHSKMDVHFSSGIYNYAFYQMVKVYGMDIFKAYECFLRANLLEWTAQTNFQQGACGVMKACYDLGYDTTQVLYGFEVVGINARRCNFAAAVPIMEAGDRRTIKVSSSRQPILSVGEITGDKVVVDAADATAKIEICSDNVCADVVATGTGSVDVTKKMAKGKHMYFRVSYTSVDDTLLGIKVHE